MSAWDDKFEIECNRLVTTIVDDSLPEKQRIAAWRDLVGRIAPHIEAWVRSSPVLRRCGLRSEDEVRTVLVGVLSRLNARSFENLRAYLSRRPLAMEEESETALIEEMARLVQPGEPEKACSSTFARWKTPFSGWLFVLTRFAIKDHVKQRFGWSTSVRVLYGLTRERGALGRAALEQSVRGVLGVLSAELDEPTLEFTVEYLPGTTQLERIDTAIESAAYRITVRPDLRRSKRDLVTGASPLDAIGEAGIRPPITDALTLRRLIAEVLAYMETFPAPMQRAMRMWIEDEAFEAIAAQLGMEDGERARALVRAGMARLRERFREQWSAIFESNR